MCRQIRGEHRERSAAAALHLSKLWTALHNTHHTRPAPAPPPPPVSSPILIRFLEPISQHYKFARNSQCQYVSYSFSFLFPHTKFSSMQPPTFNNYSACSQPQLDLGMRLHRGVLTEMLSAQSGCNSNEEKAPQKPLKVRDCIESNEKQLRVKTHGTVYATRGL